MRDPLIQGEIVLNPPLYDLTGAKLRIRLEQTSLADMPAQVVSELTLSELTARLVEGRKIPFALHGRQPNPKERYTLSVHVDMRGDGRIRSGDYINVQSYPVLTFGHPIRVEVQVLPVKGDDR